MAESPRSRGGARRDQTRSQEAGIFRGTVSRVRYLMRCLNIHMQLLASFLVFDLKLLAPQPLATDTQPCLLLCSRHRRMGPRTTTRSSSPTATRCILPRSSPSCVGCFTISAGCAQGRPRYTRALLADPTLGSVQVTGTGGGISLRDGSALFTRARALENFVCT